MPTESSDSEEREREYLSLSNGKKMAYIEYGSANDVPTVVVMPGWMSLPETIERTSAELNAEHGRHTITPDLHGGVDYNTRIDRPRGTPAIAYERMATALIEAIEQKNVGPVDIVANSLAAITVTMASAARPDLFRNVVYVNPAGMVEGDSIFSLFRRYASEGFSDARIRKEALQNISTEVRSKAEFATAWKMGLDYVASNPEQSVREIAGLTRYDIASTLSGMRYDPRYSHLRFGILHSEQDKLFPLEEIRKSAERACIDPQHIETFEGPHAAILDKPIEGSKLIADLFRRLDANRLKAEVSTEPDS